MITLWTDGKPIGRRRCALPPQTLVEGHASRMARVCTEVLYLVIVLFVLNLASVLAGKPTGGFGMIVLTLILPALCIAANAWLSEPRHFLITTQGIETDRGRMDYRDIESIDVLFSTLILRGSGHHSLTLPYMRAPYLLRDVIWAAKARQLG